MINAICQELRERASFLYGEELETVYFGGGTPSILNEVELKQIMEVVRSSFKLIPDPEITLEANPEDINDKNLEAWKAVGINRLSIGLQSFKQDDLSWMNRAHTMEQSYQCVPLAIQHGFNNITVDLIYGLPGLSIEEWKEHIDTVIDLGVPHVSAYCLTVEPKTALNSWVAKGKMNIQTEDEQIEQFKLLVDELRHNGFEQYEISNFTKPGFESRHNSNYWRGTNYLGVGPSAHSFDGSSRYWNVSNNNRYMNAVETGTSCSEKEELSSANKFNEIVLTGLRTSNGVALEKLDSIVERTSEFNKVMQGFRESGWIIEKDGVITLSEEGKLRADYIASELFIG